MSLLDGLKSVVGAAAGQNGEMLTMVTQLIEKNGGVTGLLEKFNAAGLGDIAKSWIGNGQNLSISPEQIEKVLGSPQVQEFAAKFGLDTSKVTSMLAAGLPQIMDKLSPDGQMPAVGQIASKLGDLNNLFS